MTDTAPRALPWTRAQLEEWLPAEPTAGPVPDARRAATVLFAAADAVRADLAALDNDERRHLDDLVDQVAAGTDPATITTPDDTDRRRLERRLDQFDQAARRAHARAEALRRTDAGWLSWTHRRQTLVNRWTAITRSDPELRGDLLAQLVADLAT